MMIGAGKELSGTTRRKDSLISPVAAIATPPSSRTTCCRPRNTLRQCRALCFTAHGARRIITLGHPKMCAARRMFRPRMDVSSQGCRLIDLPSSDRLASRTTPARLLSFVPGCFCTPAAQHPIHVDSRLAARHGWAPAYPSHGVN